jgi:DNA polymerase-4
MKIILSVTTAEDYEISGLDECYLNLTNIVNNNYKNAILLAKDIKNRLSRELNLSCSIGISYNKLLAKIASKYKKPNGLFVIDPNKTLKIISNLDIGIIPGIGPKNKRKLNNFGITTIKQLSEIDIAFLKKNFGNHYAEFLHNSSLGINKDPIQTKQLSKQITRIKTLKEYTNDINDIEYVKSLIAELCKSIYTDLIKRELLFKSVGLIFIDNKLGIINRSKHLKNYTQNLTDLINNANSIFLDYLSTYDIFKLRRIGIKVSEIKKDEGYQNTLFNYMEIS